jgi:hypothetical protein
MRDSVLNQEKNVLLITGKIAYDNYQHKNVIQLNEKTEWKLLN